ncbi:MAG: hypothetical protein OEY86_16610, partial [Nitrospira sp.]|nr:hypothetical protein [Nitrospira sp.]
MAADEESTGKSRGDRVSHGIDEDVAGKDNARPTDPLEAIPTAVPREGDGYKKFLQGFGDTTGTGVIGESGHELTDEDLRRINTRKGLLQLLKFKKVNLGEIRKTLLYEQELRSLQVELVKLQRWIQNSGQRIAILVEGRDAAGKGGTIRRFTEHLNPRAMRVVALPKPTDEERGQWYFQRYIRQLPNKGEIVFFDRSWYNRAVVE